MLRRIAITAGAVAALALLATGVRADDHERDEDEAHEHHERGDHHGRQREREAGRRSGAERIPAASTPAVPPGALPLYAKECGSCHLAYPPHLLPAQSWTKVMAGLDKHFGANAELDAESRATIERWLVERARKSLVDGAPLRATELPWFARKHRKVKDAVSRPSIKSLANCAACHTGADSWDFDEDGVRIPRS